MKPGLGSLILTTILVVALAPVVVYHIINSNTFGIIMGFIAEGCWITFIINDILYLARQHKQYKQDKG